MKNITISIESMTCGGCVAAVTRALQQVAGVAEVQVSLEKAQAKVDFDEGKVSAADLVTAVEEAGYDATV